MKAKRRRILEKDLYKFRIIISVVFFVLLLRLGWLQLIEVDVYRTKAENNRVRLITIPATRGNIVTNDGEVLAKDHPSFQVSISYLGLKNQDQVVKKLVDILNDPEIDVDFINNLIKENRYRLYEPIIVKRDLSIEKVSALESRRNELPGVTIESIPVRRYPYGNLAGAVQGFLGEINEKELGREGFEEYKMGDYIGKFGLEKQYDKVLRGKEGFRKVEVNVKNRPIPYSEIITLSPEPGNNLILTVDFDLQKTMEEAFDNVLADLQKNPRSDKADAGAGVLIDVKTGKILAMVSRPDDRGMSGQNKAIQGRYIPGSTFKMITGIAGLEEKKISPEEYIYNPGRYWYKPYIKSVAPIGPIDYNAAISKSCNVYFQEVGRRVGIDAIAKIGVEFGLDKPTGIDLPYEDKARYPSQGLPTPEKRLQYYDWSIEYIDMLYKSRFENIEKKYEKLLAEAVDEKEKERIQYNKKKEIKILESEKRIRVNWNTSWHNADTFNIAIGQGRQNYTPLQLANYVAGIANNGTRFKPYIVERIEDKDGNIITEFQPEVIGKAQVAQKNINYTKEAMKKTSQPGGTAYFLFYDFPKEISVGAKTGTAQPGQKGYKVNGKQYYDGLFVAFAPADDPEIAFAGVVEYGYSGSGSVGKVAREVFMEYFDLKQKN